MAENASADFAAASAALAAAVFLLLLLLSPLCLLLSLLFFSPPGGPKTGARTVPNMSQNGAKMEPKVPPESVF